MFNKPVGSLVTLVFDDMYKADECRAALLRMQGEHLLEIEEAAVIVRQTDEKYRITQDTNVVAQKQHLGHVVGLVAASLTGTLPLIMAGTVTGRLIGRFTDTGVTNAYIKEVQKELTPGTSALLLFVRTDPERRERIIARVAPFGPRILNSDLTPELQKEIDDALAAAAADA